MPPFRIWPRISPAGFSRVNVHIGAARRGGAYRVRVHLGRTDRKARNNATRLPCRAWRDGCDRLTCQAVEGESPREGRRPLPGEPTGEAAAGSRSRPVVLVPFAPSGSPTAWASSLSANWHCRLPTTAHREHRCGERSTSNLLSFIRAPVRASKTYSPVADRLRPPASVSPVTEPSLHRTARDPPDRAWVSAFSVSERASTRSP